MKKFTHAGAALCFAVLLSALPLAACGGHFTTPSAEKPDPIPHFELFGGTPDGDLSEAPAQAEYVRVLVNGLNVRTGAGTSYPALGRADKGCLLPRTDTADGWHATLCRGKPAFVSADERYTAPVFFGRADDRTEAVIGEGCRLLGVPYVYGATRFHDGAGHPLKGFTEDAFDCSSLMQYIFLRGADVLLGVTTRTQVKQGTHVERENLRRGDLLFFTNATREHNAGLERVGHVGLYLGDNYMLHTASDYAKIEPISAKRWGYFLEGRRVL